MNALVLCVLAGQFADGLSGQCCGGTVVPASQTCCSEEESGVAYSPVEGSVCCGTEYVNASTSLCCVSESGVAEVSITLRFYKISF